MKKRNKVYIGIIVAIIIAGIVMVYQNNFDMDRKNFVVETSKNKLRVVMSTPKDKDNIKGVVIFIHGDGAVDATASEGYLPAWEKLAQQGYAAVGWDKPGVKDSTGNWLDQSMEDRAVEAGEVIDYLKKEYQFKKIGLLGSSQGGWVVPKITNQRDDIAFNVLVSPAINWISQGKFYTEKEFKRLKMEEKDRKEIRDKNAKVLKLILDHKSYDEYKKVVTKDQTMSPERWVFVNKNVKSDATKDLKKINKPVLLITGGKDQLVDVSETKDIYTKTIDEKLLVINQIDTADHSMINADMSNSKLKMTLNAFFNPRGIIDEEYLNALEKYLGEQ